MDESKKDKVVALFKANARPRRAPQKPTQSIVGNGNIQAGGDVHVTAGPVISRPRVTVTPGDGVIDNAQAARLKALVLDWVSTNNTVRRSQITHAGAWAALNKKAGVTSYRLIPLELFAPLEKWLQSQIARIGNMASAPRKDGEWRTKKIGAIKARCKNQLGDEFAYGAYIRKNFGAESLTELATADLQQVYAYIMAKRAS